MPGVYVTVPELTLYMSDLVSFTNQPCRLHTRISLCTGQRGLVQGHTARAGPAFKAEVCVTLHSTALFLLKIRFSGHSAACDHCTPQPHEFGLVEIHDGFNLLEKSELQNMQRLSAGTPKELVISVLAGDPSGLDSMKIMICYSPNSWK